MNVFKVFEPIDVGDFLIIVEDHEYKDRHMSFLAFECVGLSSEGMPYYERMDGKLVDDLTSNHEDAVVFMSGSLFADGSCGFRFEEQLSKEHGHYVSVSGPKEARKYARIFDRLYQIAPKCIKNWNISPDA